MPVVAIGAAIVAGVGAAGAVGAVISGGLGALTLTGALEITAAVGATLGAVGVVTHDKSLAMAGLVIGGIGGIGALASSAGLFGAEAGTASLFGDSSDAAAGAFPGSVSVTPEIAGTNVGGYMGAGAGGSTGIVDALGGADTSNVLPQTAIDQETSAAAGSASDVTGPVPATTAPPIAGTTSAAPAAATTAGTDTSSTALLQQPAAGATPPAAPSVPPPVSPAGTDPAAGFPSSVNVTPEAPGLSPPGMFGKLGDFMSKHDYATYGLIQASGSLVSGLFNPVTPAQVEALQAQAAQNRAAAAVTATQAANMAQALPVASRAQPVASPAITGGVGLINSQPQKVAITGLPT